jgi:hypothetical protein
MIHHLFLGCVFAREVWFILLRRKEMQHLTPITDDSLTDWCCATHKQVPKLTRKGFDTFTLLTAWLVWKEWNNRILNNTSTLKELVNGDTYAVPRFRVYIGRNSPYHGRLQECVKYLDYKERNSL